MNQNVLYVWQNYRNEAAMPEEVPKIGPENSRNVIASFQAAAIATGFHGWLNRT